MLRTGQRGEYTRCGYRWTGKECPHCGEKNDIAARYCYECKGEIVDPNEKLAAEFKAMKRDPYRVQTDKVISAERKEGVSQKGNPTLRVDWVTPHRQFSTWFQPNGTHSRARKEYADFMAAGEPETVSYIKDRDSGFFRILGYNMPADVEPERMSA
jgi:DNA repair protein RadD